MCEITGFHRWGGGRNFRNLRKIIVVCPYLLIILKSSMTSFYLCLSLSLHVCLCLQGRWGREGGSVTGHHAASTAVRWCAVVEATTRRGSAGPPSASASSTGAAPCTAETATSRWTCTPARARRDRTPLADCSLHVRDCTFSGTFSIVGAQPSFHCPKISCQS